MYYEINISLRGKHFFATHPRSLTNLEKAQEVFDVLKKALPTKDGYTFTTTQQSEVGEVVPQLSDYK